MSFVTSEQNHDSNQNRSEPSFSLPSQLNGNLESETIIHRTRVTLDALTSHRLAQTKNKIRDAFNPSTHRNRVKPITKS